MRLNRILYASLLIISFIFVYYSGGKVPYMFFYTVLLLPVVSFLHMIIGYFMLKYEQIIDKDLVIKGDRVTFRANITNRSFFILPYLSISFLDDRGGIIQKQEVRNILIQPLYKKEISFDYTYKYRGHFKIGVNTIEVQDFLGIFKLSRKNKNPLYITVYPQIIDIDRFHLNSSYFSDNTSTIGGLQEDISTIEELNKYNYGDSLKKVHWKLTAKRNELMVKEYEKVGSARVIFFTDLKKSNFTAEINAVIEDKHIETTIAVLKYCLYNGADVKLVYDNEEINTIQCSSSSDFQNAYEALAKVEFNEKTTVGDIIDSETNYNINNPHIIISTSNVDSNLYDTLYKVKLSGYNVSLIYIATEGIIGEKESDSKYILSLLSELGISVYSINIDDAIGEVFK